jgi:hypothetical protein
MARHEDDEKMPNETKNMNRLRKYWKSNKLNFLFPKVS